MVELEPGWLVAVGLFVLLIFRDVLKNWLVSAADRLGAAVYGRLAGHRLLCRPALARYRRALTAHHGELSIPFLDHSRLDMRDVYVPLTVAGTGDAQSLVREAKRCVVLGAPGAGKSMLLRHLVLTWAERGDSAYVPVLLELHRLTGTTSSIVDALVGQFARDGFPDAGRYMHRALQRGDLAVHFDGLDEVSTAERPRVTQMIRDFADMYERAPIVVSCRTAVYAGQLAPQLPTVLRIGEFDERLIRRFLGRWPGMPSPAHVQQLVEALREVPRLMQLARNPLLLTMIAYLYSSGQQLPHSRAEFYQDVTDVLLRRLKDTNNRYPGPAKRRILQRLALAGLDAPASTADRLALPYEVVLRVLTDSLPALNLAPGDIEPLLAELVERSGLLLAVDGGERYQFAHLTLQEFLAARELLDDPIGLLQRYERDPTRWREGVKLWCGIRDQDSTELIAAVYGRDPLLGFECVTDAQVVDAATADHIVADMQRALGRLGLRDDDGGLFAAFAVAAADPRPRGAALLDYLGMLARQGSDWAREVFAIDILAATNVPSAARLLAELSPRRVQARTALTRMGDSAVRELAELAKSALWAVDALATIGTPAAIEVLATLLGGERAIEVRAAWNLAALVAAPEAEAALRTAPPPAAVERIVGIWDPYRTGDDGSLPAIMERVAFLLSDDAVSKDRPRTVRVPDVRLGVPLYAFGRQVGGWSTGLLAGHAATEILTAGAPANSVVRRGVRMRDWRRLSAAREIEAREVVIGLALAGGALLLCGMAVADALLVAFGVVGTYGPRWVPLAVLLTVVLGIVSGPRIERAVRSRIALRLLRKPWLEKGLPAVVVCALSLSLLVHTLGTAAALTVMLAALVATNVLLGLMTFVWNKRDSAAELLTHVLDWRARLLDGAERS